MVGKAVSTFSRLFFVRSFLCLRVMVAFMGARGSSSFGLVGPPAAGLAALERLKGDPRGLIIVGKIMSPSFLLCSWSDPFHACR